MRYLLVTCMFLLSACGISHRPDGGAGGDTDADADADGRDGSGPPPRPCLVGTAIACECPDAPDGFSFCIEGGVFGECECSPPALPEMDAGAPPDGGGLDGSAGPGGGVLDGSAGPGGGVLDGSTAPDGGVGFCTPGDDEWCDRLDNDCDRVIDEGHVCPDATVSNTLDHDLGVWMVGARVRRDPTTWGVQRLWPTRGSALATPHAYPTSMRFDSTARLHYQRTSLGVRRYTGDGADVEVPTPPCFDRVGWLIGFDGSDRMYYTCDRTLRRGAGELVQAEVPGFLAAVLSSARFVGVDNVPHANYVLFDTDGSELSRLPASEWVGTMGILGRATVAGDSAFVAMSRTYRGGTRREIVIYRVDSDGSWRLVRRIPIRDAMREGVALPDGHFIGLRMWDSDETSGVVFVFPPTGPAYLLRRDGPEEELHFDFRGSDAFFAAPRSF